MDKELSACYTMQAESSPESRQAKELLSIAPLWC